MPNIRIALLLPFFSLAVLPQGGANKGLSRQIVQYTDELANTKWECKIGKECTDQLRFKAGHKVVAQSCELDEESPGTYQLIRDTLTINLIKDGEEIKERWRYKYLLREGRLRPISTE